MYYNIEYYIIFMSLYLHMYVITTPQTCVALFPCHLTTFSPSLLLSSTSPPGCTTPQKLPSAPRYRRRQGTQSLGSGYSQQI